MIRRISGVGLLSATMLMLTAAPALADHANIWQRVHTTVAIRDLAASPSGYVAAGANGLWISANLANWTQATAPAGMGLPYNSIIWGGGLFVAGGSGGIVISANGQAWTLAYQDALNSPTINSLVYVNGVYLAVGYDNKGALVLRSTDGHTWTPEPTGLDHTGDSFTVLHSVTYGDGLYVVMGVSATATSAADVIVTSPDGINWTQANLPEGGANVFSLAYDGAYGNGVFVEGGDNGVYTSTDGINWSAEYFPETSFWIMMRIAFVDNQFVAVGTDYDTYPLYSAVFTSPDGINWTKHDLILKRAPTDLGISSIIYQDGGYVLSGYYGVWSSPDAVKWSRVFSGPQSNGYACLGYGDGSYVMLPAEVSGTGSLILRSSDGTNWPDRLTKEGRQIGGGSQPGCLADGGDRFVAGGFDGASHLFYSSDGVSWTAARSSGNARFGSVAWNGSKFLSLGGFFNGTEIVAGVYASPDGAAWRRLSAAGLPASDLGYFSLRSANGVFFAWQYAPPLYTSSSGRDWTTAAFPSGFSSLADIAYGGGRYVAVGDGADGRLAIATSTNGLDWTTETGLPRNLSTQSLYRIAFGGGEFMVPVFDSATQLGAYLTSHDGLHWAETSQPDSAILQTIIWDGTKFVGSSFYDIFNAPGVKLDLAGKAKVIRDNGAHVRYTFSLMNDSIDDTTAHNAVVSDPLPADTVFEDATTSQGRCNLRDNTVVCRLGDLAPAMMARVVIQISVTQSVCSISNSAKSYADEPVRDDGTPETTVTISRPHC